MKEQIKFIFGIQTTLDLSHIMLKGNSGISKNTVLLSETLSQTLDLENFDHRNCGQLRWTLNVINWRWSSVASLSH